MDFNHRKTQQSRRKYILSEQNNKCNHCGLDTWRGKPLTLEMDHIDGDRTNNSRENLECICPNCHSQTPTWRAKNKGRSKRISDDEYAEAIRECGTIHPALIKLGLAPKGGNYKRAKHIVEKYGLDVRVPNGERCTNALLTNDQAQEIRNLRSTGWKLRELAVRFGVGLWVIKSLLSGKTYRD